jgi:putative ABC transport system permease protein
MRRLTWSQLRFRPARLIALLAGLLLAVTAFTVLTAASRTSQLQTIGTVSANFVPSYDILVRPKGAETALESQTSSVQPNFLSGIYGGISMSQYHEIARIPGVTVAAPVAMVGYTLLSVPIAFRIPAADYAKPGDQLYRVTTTWVSANGTSRVPHPPSYVYVTPDKLDYNNNTGNLVEAIPGRGSTQVCPLGTASHPGHNPFGPAVQSDAECWSKADGSGLAFLHEPTGGTAEYEADWVIPVLIAAVDPAAEAKLDGLNKALTSGQYLAENAGDTKDGNIATAFPVLAASASGVGEYAQTQLQALSSPPAPPNMTTAWMTREASAPGKTVAVEKTTAQQAYSELLAGLEKTGTKGGPAYAAPVSGYWTAGQVSYQKTASGALAPVPVSNPASIWYTGPIPVVSMDNADTQYRQLTVHSSQTNEFQGHGPLYAAPRLVGVFNPAKIESFSPLSQVPLGVYQPVTAAPGDAATSAALGGGDLLPNQNLGGFVSQPVDLITTLSALPALESNDQYGSDLPTDDPVSVIRVRVAGVTGPDALSLARIREVAQQISAKTGLTVDIVAGSSPKPQAIDLPAGKFGQPALTLTEDWVKKGVALTILTAVDRESVALFVLILVVCVLFTASSASAAVRSRRRELGVLACLGWTRPRLFASVLGELAAIGLATGVLGAAIALPLSSALGLHASPARAALAVPVAIAVALLAGVVPAWQASRAEPVAAVRPPVLGVRRRRAPRGITGLAVSNVARTPGRALLGAASLAVGIAALTILTAVTFAFRGNVVGTLLGDAIAVQVRGVDYVAAGATIALGVLSVADAVFIGITERAAEIAAIRSFGWREGVLARLVVTEGVIIGVAGSLAGATAGLLAASRFAGQLPTSLYAIAGSTVAAGLLVTALAALTSAQSLRRVPAARLLAEE